MELLHQARIDWHGVSLGKPDTGYESRSLAFSVWGRDAIFHLILNAYWEPLCFELPSLTADAYGGWLRILDTSLPPPNDFQDPAQASPVGSLLYQAEARSIVLLAVETPKSAIYRSML